MDNILEKIKQWNIYRHYIKRQINRSKRKAKQRNIKEINRKKILVNLLYEHVDLTKIENALVIGCRNIDEIDLLISQGIKNVTGIDLFSVDKRIKVMDMHDIKFADNTFDLVYASHSLEHAFNYKKVFKEIVRVLKPDGIICAEVPINFKISKADLNDFISAGELFNEFHKLSHFEVLFSGNYAKDHEENFSGTEVARLLFKMK